MLRGRYYRVRGPVARACGKDVFISIYVFGRLGKESAGIRELISVLRRPSKKLRDRSEPIVSGFVRRVYVSYKNRLVVFVEEDENIMVIMSWEKVERIKEFVNAMIRKGVWIEEK